MTLAPHPYAAARAVLKELHKIFLEQGDRNWSVSPSRDAKENFAHLGLDEDGAWKALRLLVAKNLAEHRGTHAFVITDYGVSACDHPDTLDHELPLPTGEASVPAVPRDATSSGGPPRPDLEQYVPGELRSRFAAVDHIGGGSFGNVYQIVDRDTQQRFALKVTISAPDAKARAVREVEAMRTLNHENVLRALETHPQGDWFIFPLAEGTLGNLHAWRRLGASAALEVAVQVGGALVHAHGAGFLHRDLHVDNVLRFDGAWLVADWGLTVARGSERMTRTRSIGGNQTWTAPEQLRGLKNADERSDLFSLGRLVEWLATGNLPDPARPGSLPNDHPLASFVNAATRLAVDERPKTVAEALALLPSAAPNQPGRGVQPPPGRAPSVVAKATLEHLAGRHRARLDEIVATRRAAVPLDDGPAVVLHAYPSDSAGEVDLLTLKQGNFEPLPTVAHLPWSVKFNYDGLVAQWPDAGPASQQVLVYRDGCIELVDTYAVQRVHAGEPVLFPLKLERDIVSFLEHWTEKILTPLGIAGPLVVCLGIIGIENFELHIDHRPPHHRKPTFDRALLSFRPVVLDGVEDLRRRFKPVFDALWQAAGEDRSRGYSATGEWIEEVHPKR